MKLLLDTHLLLWAATAPQRLSAEARGLFNDLDNELYFTQATVLGDLHDMSQFFST